ncbi:hypothetical protein O6H91_17G041100 [Diphasiastrum complanatum]|uniref:Uncharacterized protein n=1 Tax=Diphasiastrum complanatum TaxID=34168 RepID=A0ACC2B6Z0_DIPCM|nr:hypothetical protein O6H91_17G041100 [Diphasiastrum complanatum]
MDSSGVYEDVVANKVEREKATNAAVSEKNLGLVEKRATIAERDAGLLQRNVAYADRDSIYLDRDRAMVALKFATANMKACSRCS